MMPKFSIIIPVYNVAPYLRECLDSVLAQTFSDWEAICVDDGSTDGSGVILDEYAAKDKRFRVIHQKNAGVSAARNIALDVAHGEWVWCVDADDIVATYALTSVLEALKCHQDATCVTFTKYVTNVNDFVPSYDSKLVEYSVFREVSDDWLMEYMGGIWRYFLHRRSIGDLRFRNYKLNEDGIFMMEFAWRSPCVVNMDMPLYCYRCREGSATKIVPKVDDVSRVFDAQREMIQVLLDHQDRWEGVSLEGCWRHLHGFCYFGYFGMYFRLPVAGRRILLSKWIALQDMFRGRYPMPMSWRVAVFLSSLFRSGLLVKVFVFGRSHFVPYVKRRICSFLKSL